MWALLLTQSPGFWNALANIFLVQSWVPLDGVFFGYNRPSWFLSSLVFMMLMTPLLLKVRWWWFAVAAAAYAALMAFVPHEWYGEFSPRWDAWQSWAIYSCPLTRTIDFTLGIALYKLCDRWRLKGSTLLEAGAVVLLLLSMWFAHGHVGVPFRLASWWWIPVGVLIAVFAAQGGWFGRVLAWRPFVWFGEISFSFYLIHDIVIKMLLPLHESLGKIEAGFMILALAIGLSSLSHYFFEKPAAKLIKKLTT